MNVATICYSTQNPFLAIFKAVLEVFGYNPVFSTNAQNMMYLGVFLCFATTLQQLIANDAVNILKKLKEYVLLEGVKPEYKLAIFNDSGSGRSTISYYVFNSEKGSLERVQIFISKKYDTSEKRKAFAEAVIIQINAALMAGYHINQSIKKTLKTADAVRLYLDYKLPKVRATKDYRTFFENYFAPYCEENNLLYAARITKADIIKMLEYWQNKLGWAAKTRNTKKRLVYNFFEYLKENHGLVSNPALGISQQREQHSMQHMPFQTDELAYVKDFIRHKDPELYLFTQFIYYTFLRPKELRLIRLMDVNLSSSTIRISKDVAKAKTAQTVQIPNALKELIREVHLLDYPKNLFLFSAGGEPGAKKYGENTLTVRHKKLLTELGYGSEYSLYSWKHTGCCALYMQTKDIELVQRQCRHSDIGITQIYLRQLGVMRSDALLDFK